jgi:glycosyltransferase involved in cell wall biosynthesis
VKFLANSPAEREALGAVGLDAMYCNQNAFLDWDRYPLDPTAKPTFDAVYLARITPFKRHALARDVKSLYLIGEYRDSEMEYGKATLAQLTCQERKRTIPSRHVPREIQRARVGLCLSEIEGAMFVSLEYLLSGRPVVSTRSIGGRDTFFDHAAATIVDDTPEAVAVGVRAMIEAPLDQAAIREMCIEKMRVHRGYLTQAIEDLLDHNGERARFQASWNKIYTHKLALRCWPAADASPARLPIKGLSLSRLEKLGV